MARYIDAEKLIMLVRDATILSDGFKNIFIAIVSGEPTADVVEVVRDNDGKMIGYKRNIADVLKEETEDGKYNSPDSRESAG